MSSFWEPIFFCNGNNTGCADQCQRDAEEDDLDEEFARIVYQSQDEHIAGGAILDPEVYEYTARQNLCTEEGRNYVATAPPVREKFSLPWADLDGNQKESLVTSVPYTNSASPGTSGAFSTILPLSNGSTGSSFNNLYRPIFVTGIPTKAYQYKPDMADPIDIEVHRALRSLSPEASQLVALRCVEAGRYEIEGRTCSVYWASSGLQVHEDGIGASIPDLALLAYINLVANVSVDLQRLAKNETFLSAGAATHDPKIDGDDRFRAMQVACMQAKIREEAAERQNAASVQKSVRVSRG